MMWPSGATSVGMHCGIKHRADDLGAIVFAEPVHWSGVFTQNAAAAAPVRWCRSREESRVSCIIVNSGNANACTGSMGDSAVRDIANAVAASLGCRTEEVLVASTGPIGVPLPVDKITSALPQLLSSTGPDVDGFASSILTTDSTTKVASRSAGAATVTGVAKGAAMIAPNMATMLAFLVTDAAVDNEGLGKILGPAVDRTFNRISIDGCESTNDSVFLFSVGSEELDASVLAEAVEEVCADLAAQIIDDAEGGTKVLHITVEGATDEGHAVTLARSIATSDLWRAAAHGNDPNWGRILSAMGAVDRTLDVGLVEVWIGAERVFAGDGPVGSLARAGQHLNSADVDIRCVVGSGAGSATFLCPDLSEEYVSLNADITT